MWFRDVVDEAEKQGHHTMVVQITHSMAIFIASGQCFCCGWGIFSEFVSTEAKRHGHQ